MTINDVYAYYNYNWSNMMRDNNLSAASYTYWKKVGYIPYTTQLKIQKITKGRLKATHGPAVDRKPEKTYKVNL